MAEDPAEDLFVALVNTTSGNFRVFEGIREGNAFHLQNVLNVVEGMPTGGGFERLRACVDSLLKISEAVAQRADVRENMHGQKSPLKSLPADLITDPSRLRHAIKFAARDLDRLQIQRETLAEFAFDFGARDTLSGTCNTHGTTWRAE